MAQNGKEEATWLEFDGVTWVDAYCDGSEKTNGTDGFASNTVPRDNSVTASDRYELQLGVLLIFPTEIIYDILSRLPVEDIMRGRIVCKSWNKLTRDSHFIHMQVSKAIARRPSSLVLKQSTVGAENSLFLIDIADEQQWRSKEIPLESFYENGNKMHLSVSCNGLLLSNRINTPTIVYNPITKDCITLPKSDFQHSKLSSFTISGFGFGFDSTSNKYKVVQVHNVYQSDEFRKFHTMGEVITLGESCWRSLNFPHKVGIDGNINAVFLNGAFHWTIHRENECSSSDVILVLDIISEKFQTIKFPSSIKLPKDLNLINLGKSLGLVKQNGFDRDLFQVWQIVGDRANGGRIYQFTFDPSVIIKDGHLNRGLTLLGMLNGGDFLYKALATSDIDHSFNAFRNHLVRYSPQKKKGVIVEVPGIPRCFHSICFLPSLATPCMLS